MYEKWYIDIYTYIFVHIFILFRSISTYAKFFRKPAGYGFVRGLTKVYKVPLNQRKRFGEEKSGWLSASVGWKLIRLRMFFGYKTRHFLADFLVHKDSCDVPSSKVVTFRPLEGAELQIWWRCHARGKCVHQYVHIWCIPLQFFWWDLRICRMYTTSLTDLTLCC